MDTRKLSHTKGTTVIRCNDAHIASVHHDSRTAPREYARNMAAEIVKRWNEYPQQAERIAKLEEALKDLFDNCVMVHKHWGDGGNSKQAKEAEDRARALLQTLKA